MGDSLASVPLQSIVRLPPRVLALATFPTEVRYRPVTDSLIDLPHSTKP